MFIPVLSVIQDNISDSKKTELELFFFLYSYIIIKNESAPGSVCLGLVTIPFLIAF